MSAFQQNLPVQIVPKENNPEGLKFQGILDAMESTRMKIKIDHSFLTEDRGKEILVEFTMSGYNFSFESTLLPEKDNEFIYIFKPKVIHKSQIRKTTRLSSYIRFNFTIWTEGGRYDGIITDLSTVGLRMTCEKRLSKGSILSVNVFIPGTSLRFICQGLVMWCNQDPNQEKLYLSGVKFTTLSMDALKKVDRYIQEKIKTEVPNQ